MNVVQLLIRPASLIVLGWATQCFAGNVSVSESFSSLNQTAVQRVQAGAIALIPIGTLEAGDRYGVTVTSDNKVYPDISGYVVDQANANSFASRQGFQGNGYARRPAPYLITGVAAASGPMFLAVDNRYSLLVTKIVSAQINVVKVLPEEQRQAISRNIASVMSAALRDYELPSFDVDVSPCGVVNASSETKTGRIRLCTEMMAKTSSRPGAFLGILFHEVGHTALNLWGLPGASNEETADEFAVQLLLRARNGESLVQEFSEFFQSGSPWLEARSIIERGDKHPISVQRIRNIQFTASNRTEIIERWNKLLYPRFKTEALRRIIATPVSTDSPQLAQEELRKR